DGLASSLISLSIGDASAVPVNDAVAQSSIVPPPQKNRRKSRNTQIALSQRKSTRIKKAASKARDGLASSLISLSIGDASAVPVNDAVAQSSIVPPPQKNRRKSRNTQIALSQRKSTRIKKASTKYS
ncbi:hypothetical protein L195_g048979, partial [Trifolium pratense]